MMSAPLGDIVSLVEQRLDRLGISHSGALDFASVVDLYRQRVSTINELVDSILYFFQDFAEYDAKATAKVLKPPALQALQCLSERFAALDDWSAAEIHAVIEAITVELDVGMGKIGQPLRVAVTGGSFSPPIDQTVELLGKERCLTRLERAIAHVSSK